MKENIKFITIKKRPEMTKPTANGTEYLLLLLLWL